MKSILLSYAYVGVVFSILVGCFLVVSLMHIRFQTAFAMHQAMEKGVRMHDSKEGVAKAMETILSENGLSEFTLEIIEFEQYPNLLKGRLQVKSFGYLFDIERVMVEEVSG